MNEVTTFALSPPLEGLLRAIYKKKFQQIAHPDALILSRFGLIRLQPDVTWTITKKAENYLLD